MGQHHFLCSVIQVLLIWSSLCQAQAGKCPSGGTFNRFGGSCLYVNKVMRAREDALNGCARYGSLSDLIKIKSLEENDFVIGLIRGTGLGFWTGLHPNTTNDVYRWNDEPVAVNYTNWGPGEPRLKTGGCMFLRPDLSSYWFMDDCSTRFGSICQVYQQCIGAKRGRVNCLPSCSPHCKPKDGVKRECSKDTGDCFFGCTEGYEGIKCTDTCHDKFSFGEDCAEKCSTLCKTPTNPGERLCEAVSGKCTSDCVGGFGEKCLPEDPGKGQGGGGSGQGGGGSGQGGDGSGAGAGDDDTSSHQLLCPVGYTGEYCNKTCAEGTYGQSCTHKCSEECAGGSRNCDKKNGTCKTGCKPGWQGPRCLTRTSSKLTTIEHLIINGCLYFALSAISTVVALLIVADEKREIAAEREKLIKALEEQTKKQLESEEGAEPEPDLEDAAQTEQDPEQNLELEQDPDAEQNADAEQDADAEQNPDMDQNPNPDQTQA